MKLTKFDQEISQRISSSIIHEKYDIYEIEQKIKNSIKDLVNGWYKFTINKLIDKFSIEFTYCPTEFSMKTILIIIK